MGAQPKRKTAKGKKNRRRAHLFENLIKPTVIEDKKTGRMVEKHRVDPVTGEYNGRKVISVD